MPYEGETIYTFTDGAGHEREVKRLTPDERRTAGRDLFCLSPGSHWVPAPFLTSTGIKEMAFGGALLTAAAIATGVGYDGDPIVKR